MVWQPNICNVSVLWAFGRGVCPWTPLGDFCPPDTMCPRPPTSKSWLRHCTLGQTQLTGFTQRSANEFLDLVTSLLKYCFVLTDYRNVSANLVVFGTVFGKKKFGEDRTCSCEDMIVDRQTHTQIRSRMGCYKQKTRTGVFMLNEILCTVRTVPDSSLHQS